MSYVNGGIHMNNYNNNCDKSLKRTEEVKLNKDIIATTGTIITFDLLDHGENETTNHKLKLVDRSKNSDNELSTESIVGKKIQNHVIGDVIDYEVNSNKFTITILNIEN
jgi:transcription elongation GreA/GreB family factor